MGDRVLDEGGDCAIDRSSSKAVRALKLTILQTTRNPHLSSNLDAAEQAH